MKINFALARGPQGGFFRTSHTVCFPIGVAVLDLCYIQLPFVCGFDIQNCRFSLCFSSFLGRHGPLSRVRKQLVGTLPYQCRVQTLSVSSLYKNTRNRFFRHFLCFVLTCFMLLKILVEVFGHFLTMSKSSGRPLKTSKRTNEN